eukprot:5552742-Pyramimonas_sp.AAC.1
MANHRLRLTPFERKRCTGHHQHASVCSTDLARAAQCTPKMQPPFVDAVQIAHDLFLVNRDPFHDHPHSSFAFVTNMRGFDLDDPCIPRRPDGSIIRPPSRRWGCPACAGNSDMHSPSHDRDPKHCRWYDKEDYHWECPSCKKNHGQARPGHSRTPGKCNFAK